MKAYYFGCYEQVGHHLWNQDMQRTETWEVRSLLRNIQGKLLDGPFCPPKSQGQEGMAVFHYRGDYTILSYWDYTVDSRPASHSTFFLLGLMPPHEVIRQARANFPKVWERYPETFGVRFFHELLERIY